MHRLISSLRNLFRQKQADHELGDEIDSHVQLLADEYVAGGMAPEAARRAAVIEIGGREQLRAEVREGRTGILLEQIWQDVRYGMRTLLKSRGFAALAVFTLALGIGANTAMFSVINAVLLQKPPFADPSRVMMVLQKQPNGNNNIFSTPDYLEWKRQASPIAKMSAITFDTHTLGSPDGAERIQGWAASYEIFDVLGVSPVLGRVFTADEDRPGAGNFVVITDSLWKSRFHGDSGVLGNKLDLDGVPYTVIGVMPAGFHLFPYATEQFWTPLQMKTQDAASASRTIHWITPMVRLEPGDSIKKAQNELDAIAARLHQTDPTGDAGFGVNLTSYQEQITGNVREPLLLLMGCVGFVLLIACSNVANLLLARGTARRLEISIRSAVGAQRSRVVRQLLTESLLLSLLGGGLGLVLAVTLLRVLVALHPAYIPDASLQGLGTSAIDTSVLLFTMAICVTVGLLFGILPALTSSRVNLTNALRDAMRGTGNASGRHRAALVIMETALASILLIGAGLSLKSLWKVGKVDPGFNPSGLLTFRISAPPAFAKQPYLFYQQVSEKIGALPGVQSVAFARDIPLNGVDPSMPVGVDGIAPQVTDGQIVTRFRLVGPDYFHTFQTQILQGREFKQEDTSAAQPVVIVSKSLADRYWPKASPIGRSLHPNIADAPWYTVIGVAADVHHQGLENDIEPTAYYPYTQMARSMIPTVEKTTTMVVKSSNATGLTDSIRRAVATVDKTVPIFQMQTVDQLLLDAGSLRRFDMWLFGAFAGLALVLAAVGVYGVMAYLVAQRTREIGIRMALGAKRADVLRMIVSHGAKMAAAGVAVGAVGSFALTRVMASLLYQVSPTDLWTFFFVTIGVFAFILLACYLPSLRATRVDPNVALRCE
jgi:putative ABC transport system permease protein